MTKYQKIAWQKIAWQKIARRIVLLLLVIAVCPATERKALAGDYGQGSAGDITITGVQYISAYADKEFSNLTVPAGAALVINQNCTVKVQNSLVIQGTVYNTGSLAIDFQAKNINMAGANIYTVNGVNGVAAVYGTNGTSGGNIILRADSIVSRNTILKTGNGGLGGDCSVSGYGWSWTPRGSGAGGHGGSITIETSLFDFGANSNFQFGNGGASGYVTYDVRDAAWPSTYPVPAAGNAGNGGDLHIILNGTSPVPLNIVNRALNIINGNGGQGRYYQYNEDSQWYVGHGRGTTRDVVLNCDYHQENLLGNFDEFVSGLGLGTPKYNNIDFTYGITPVAGEMIEDDLLKVQFTANLWQIFSKFNYVQLAISFDDGNTYTQLVDTPMLQTVTYQFSSEDRGKKFKLGITPHGYKNYAFTFNGTTYKYNSSLPNFMISEKPFIEIPGLIIAAEDNKPPVIKVSAGNYQKEKAYLFDVETVVTDDRDSYAQMTAAYRIDEGEWTPVILAGSNYKFELNLAAYLGVQPEELPEGEYTLYFRVRDGRTNTSVHSALLNYSKSKAQMTDRQYKDFVAARLNELYKPEIKVGWEGGRTAVPAGNAGSVPLRVTRTATTEAMAYEVAYGSTVIKQGTLDSEIITLDLTSLPPGYQTIKIKFITAEKTEVLKELSIWKL